MKILEITPQFISIFFYYKGNKILYIRNHKNNAYYLFKITKSYYRLYSLF